MIVGAVVVVVFVLGAAALVVRGLADDGANGVDVGAGPRSEPTEAWSVALDGDADRVSVLSDGDRVYAITTVEDDEGFTATTTIAAHAASDGTELWSETVDDAGRQERIRVLGDEVLLSSRADGTESVRLLDAETGAEVWEAEGELTDAQAAIGLRLRLDAGGLDPLLLTVEDETVVAVDRATGDEVWDAAAEDALPCGTDLVVTYTNGESDEDSVAPSPGQVVVRDADTGEERWSTDAYPGFCDGGRIALGTAGDEVAIRAADDGEELSTLAIDRSGDDAFIYAIPFGEHVAVTRFTFDSEDAYSAVFPIEGGDPTWEGVGSSAFPVSDDVVLIGEGSGSGAALVRASDGEELRRVDVGGGGGRGCDGTLTTRSILVCASTSPEVTSYELGADLDELWTVDVGFDVSAIAVGGDTLFAIDDTELVAYR